VGVRGSNPLLKCQGQPRKIRDGYLESGRIDITPRQPRSRGEDTLSGLKSDELHVRSVWRYSPLNTTFRKIWEVKGGLNHG